MTQPPLPDSAPPAERRVVRCEACHRPLRDPVSRTAGRGPRCGHQPLPTPRGFDVEQDVLPWEDDQHA